MVEFSARQGRERHRQEPRAAVRQLGYLALMLVQVSGGEQRDDDVGLLPEPRAFGGLSQPQLDVARSCHLDIAGLSRAQSTSQQLDELLDLASSRRFLRRRAD